MDYAAMNMIFQVIKKQEENYNGRKTQRIEEVSQDGAWGRRIGAVVKDFVKKAA